MAGNLGNNAMKYIPVGGGCECCCTANDFRTRDGNAALPIFALLLLIVCGPLWIRSAVKAEGCHSIGLDSNLLHLDYPMLALLRADKTQRKLSYVSVNNGPRDTNRKRSHLVS
jgi:hypothetical protein